LYCQYRSVCTACFARLLIGSCADVGGVNGNFACCRDAQGNELVTRFKATICEKRRGETIISSVCPFIDTSQTGTSDGKRETCPCCSVSLAQSLHVSRPVSLHLSPISVTAFPCVSSGDLTEIYKLLREVFAAFRSCVCSLAGRHPCVCIPRFAPWLVGTCADVGGDVGSLYRTV
jgi:hypothetical protein